MPEDLEQWIENQILKGLSEQKIEETLVNQGYNRQTIKQSLERVKNKINNQQNVENQGNGSISGINLTDNEYFVKQHMVRNKYEVYDNRDNLILKAKQKLFKLKEEIPFTDPNDNVIFSINAQQILDVSGDYTLVDKTRGDDQFLSILQKDFTFFRHSWKIKDRDGNIMANVTSRSMIFDILRAMSNLFNILPFKYSIEDTEGNKMGEIKEKFSFRDKYWVRVDNSGNIPKETLIASAIAIDALEGH